jgi:hypothetical protein
LYSCRCRSSSFYFPTMTPGASSRVSLLRRFSSGGGGSSDAVFGGRRRSLLNICLGERVFFGAGRVRYGWSFAIAFGRDLLPRSSGSCVAVVLMAGGAATSGLLSSMSTTAAPDCGFPCQRRSGSGRWSFNVLSASWSVHGVVFCGESKAWSCSPVVLAGGF